MTKRLICLMMCLVMACACASALAGTQETAAPEKGTPAPALDAPAADGRIFGYVAMLPGEGEATVFATPEDNWDQVVLYAASGVRVEVLGEEGGWLHVAFGPSDGGVGYLEGYLPLTQVAIGAAPVEVYSTIQTGTVPEGTEVEVRAQMDITAEVVASLPENTDVQVLGQRGNWSLVELASGFGFVRTSTLMPWYSDPGNLWELLFIYPGDGTDSAPLYAEMDESTRIGEMRKGAVCHLTDVKGNWGRVEFSEMYSDLTGYVQVTDLIPGVSPNLLESGVHVAVLHPAAGEETQPIRVKPSDTARSVGAYLDGTLVEWVGTFDDGWSYVRIGFDTGYVPTDRLEDTGRLTNLSDRGTAVPPQGFGRLSAKDLNGDGADSMVQIYQTAVESAPVVMETWRANQEPVDLLADLGDWVQARLYYDFNQGFIPKGDNLEMVWLADITPTLDAPLAAGSYTAGKDMPAGLYTLTADALEPGTLQTTGSHSLNLQTVAGAQYTVYLPEGDAITFDKGTLDAIEQSYIVDERTDWRFAGSGRYLMSVQIPGLSGLKFFAFPETDDREGTVRIIKDELFGDAAVIEEHTLTFGTEVLVEEFPQGAFVELDNVVLTAFFGNG